MICSFCKQQHDNEGDRYGCPWCHGEGLDNNTQGRKDMQAAIQTDENGLTFADHVRHWEQVCAATAADLERCPYDDRLERDLKEAETELWQAQRRSLAAAE